MHIARKIQFCTLFSILSLTSLTGCKKMDLVDDTEFLVGNWSIFGAWSGIVAEPGLPWAEEGVELEFLSKGVYKVRNAKGKVIERGRIIAAEKDLVSGHPDAYLLNVENNAEGKEQFLSAYQQRRMACVIYKMQTDTLKIAHRTATESDWYEVHCTAKK